MKRKILAAVLILAMLLTLCACGKKEEKESSSEETVSVSEAKTEPVTEKETETSRPEDSNAFHIGDALISYLDFDFDVTPAGDDALVLRYRYTNEGKTAAAFSPGVSFIVTQDGKPLSVCSVTTPDSDVIFLQDSLEAPVEPGKSLEVYITCLLTEFTAPVNIVFNNPDYSQTFGQVVEISGHPAPEQEVPPAEPGLGEKLTGTYCYTDEYGELVTVDIRETGGMLVLEFGRWAGDSFYDTWAEEFWPDDAADLENPDSISINGESLRFSFMSMAGEYWEGENDRTITLMGEELTLDYDGEQKESFLRDPENHEIHSSGEQLKEVLTDSYAAREELRPAGLWSFIDRTAEAVLDLREDSTFLMVIKEQSEPIRYITGAWGADAGTGNLLLLGESAGCGRMPGIYQIEWDLSNRGNLLLKNAGDDSLLPLDAELEFIPGTHLFNPELAEVEVENAGGFLDEAPVEDGYEASGTYTDSFGTEFAYDYELPVLQGNSASVQAINQAISDDFQGKIDQALDSIRTQGGTDLMSVDWEAGTYGGLVCIRVFETYAFGFTDYGIYYYDAFKDEVLNQDQVLEQMGISRDRFLEATREAARACVEEDGSQLTDEEKKEWGFDNVLNWTISDENISYENLRIFVDEERNIGVVLPIGSMAGADWYYRAVYPVF